MRHVSMPLAAYSAPRVEGRRDAPVKERGLRLGGNVIPIGHQTCVSGQTLAADLVFLATGYKGQESVRCPRHPGTWW